MKINNLSIGIINLSVSNILSVYEGCRKAGYNVEVIDKKNCKFKYDIIIVPGVGSFSSGMKYFNENNFSEKIKDYLTKPNALVYGICLGMQLLFKKSYEFKETKGCYALYSSFGVLCEKWNTYSNASLSHGYIL